MQGIELSRRFYVDVVRPWLSAVAPELRYAAALMGYGSELLGFDDETVAGPQLGAARLSGGRPGPLLQVCAPTGRRVLPDRTG